MYIQSKLLIKLLLPIPVNSAL